MRAHGNVIREIVRRAAAVVALCVAAAILFACGGPDDIDISGYADQTIELTGAADDPVELTIEDLKGMECETVKTHSTSDKIGEVRATGPWLDTVLAAYGLKQEDFSKIVITGEDDYDIKLYHDFLKKNKIMLAYGIDGEPLAEDAVPCRIIIRRSDSAYWVRRVTRIELVQ